MPESRDVPLAERVNDLGRIDAAHARAVREALLAHARAGRSVPVSDNGRVVWLSPEEILRRYADEPTNP